MDWVVGEIKREEHASSLFKSFSFLQRIVSVLKGVGLVTFLLNLGYAFIYCEDSTAFWTLNLCILRNPCTPNRKNC